MFIVYDLAANVVTHTFHLEITANVIARVMESEGRNVIVVPESERPRSFERDYGYTLNAE